MGKPKERFLERGKGALQQVEKKVEQLTFRSGEERGRRGTWREGEEQKRGMPNGLYGST
jgi:hypothetical protein